MKPLEILQAQAIMYSISKKFHFSYVPAISSENILSDKGRTLARCNKLIRSLDYYYPQDYKTITKELEKHIEIFENLFSEIKQGCIEKIQLELLGNDYTNLKSYLQMLNNAQSAYDFIVSIENDVRKMCAGDWKKYLTDVNLMKINEPIEDFAFIIQAISNFNPAWIMKGPAVSTSLIIGKHIHTYQNKRIGLLYKLTKDNFIFHSLSDSYTNLTKLTSDTGILNAMLYWELISEFYHLDFSFDPYACFYPYNIFIEKWKYRIANTSVNAKDYYNEVLLKPDFENDCIGIAILPDASQDEERKAHMLAELFGVPIIKVTENSATRL